MQIKIRLVAIKVVFNFIVVHPEYLLSNLFIQPWEKKLTNTIPVISFLLPIPLDYSGLLQSNLRLQSI